MYTYTATHKFLVLAPVQSAPLRVAKENKFLVLSPTESPALSPIDEQMETESTISSLARERSDSQSSSDSTAQIRRTVSRLPGGFLYLGHDARRPSIPSV
ncbi:hypothetical protein BJY04DRAFT_219449 [Aspergillus karnatakaensis]|uniref:uncharacterized protein n=1 Tax=Aspergillus karnatakaensis TaxID=1810916 RepID=UPI003CCD4DBD